MKTIIISLGVAVLLIVGAVYLGKNATPSPTTPVQNVHMENGKQIIDISVKGGYSPRKSIAKPGIPTVIRFKTAGTFDCSSFIRIPSKNVSMALPRSGSTDVEIGGGETGTLQGFCSMGMYPFEIDFQS